MGAHVAEPRPASRMGPGKAATAASAGAVVRSAGAATAACSGANPAYARALTTKTTPRAGSGRCASASRRSTSHPPGDAAAGPTPFHRSACRCRSRRGRSHGRRPPAGTSWGGTPNRSGPASFSSTAPATAASWRIRVGRTARRPAAGPARACGRARGRWASLLPRTGRTVRSCGIHPHQWMNATHLLNCPDDSETGTSQEGGRTRRMNAADSSAARRPWAAAPRVRCSGGQPALQETVGQV